MRSVRIMAYGYTLCGEQWGIDRERPAFCRVYLPYGGDCRYRDEQGTRLLRRGRLYLMPQHKKYSMFHSLSDPFLVLWQHIQFEGAFLPQFTELELRPEGLPRQLLDTILSFTKAEEPDAAPAERREFVKRLECLTQVLGSLLEQEYGPLFVSYHGRMGRTLTVPALQDGEYRSVAEMASAAGMERSYFSRTFHAQFGVTPQQWLAQTRLSAAAQSLLEGATVWEAAEAAGYRDAKSFTRAFGREFGRTPSAYKSSHNLQP